MFKIYKYFFYQFYKIAKKTEKQWPQGLQIPVFVANISFSAFLMFLIFPYSLLVEDPKISDLTAFIPMIICVIVFIFNYLYIIRTQLYELDEIQFDNLPEKNKIILRCLFILVIVFSLVTFVFIGNRTKSASDKSIYQRSKLLTIGMTTNDFQTLMGTHSDGIVDENNNLAYYYDIKIDTICGLEITIDRERKIIKRIYYKKCFKN